MNKPQAITYDVIVEAGGWVNSTYIDRHGGFASSCSVLVKDGYVEKRDFVCKRGYSQPEWKVM
jgi:hypothetical protein